jgi:hypothetical protein
MPVKIDPRHEISRFNKGIVLMHDLQDQKGALQAWEELVKINPIAKAPLIPLPRRLTDNPSRNWLKN